MVRDHNGQQLAYVYFEDEPARRSAAKLLTRDEARRIAARTVRTDQIVGKASGQTISRTNSTIIAANTVNTIHGDGISMDHDLVVIIERSRRTLCASHHWHLIG